MKLERTFLWSNKIKLHGTETSPVIGNVLLLKKALSTVGCTPIYLVICLNLSPLISKPVTWWYYLNDRVSVFVSN